MTENEVQEVQQTTKGEMSDAKAKRIARIITIIIVVAIVAFIWHLLGGNSKKEEVRPTFAECMTTSRLVLEDYLTAPSTAKFSYYDEDWQIVRTDNRVKMESFVDSQNAFGATVRSEFLIIVTYSDDYSTFNINTVEIDGQRYVG